MSIKNKVTALPFQTRARTVDHLGREQIADCPTAISELWKNAYDAYASKVELHLYDEEEPVAVIVDDGHGMNKSEFVDKWLVVGTESKAVNKTTPIEDRNGFPERIRQGQKGIGRLSCANLAPLLLLVSKRRNHKFVASLIDWRLFENPYMILSDIKIPVVEFEDKSELLPLVPALFDELLTNLWGEPVNENDDTGAKALKEEHRIRVENAWQAYDQFMKQNANAKEKFTAPSALIEQTLITTVFNKIHLEQWPVWNGEKEHGTALMMSNLDYTLRVILNHKGVQLDDAARDTKDNFVQTLNAFIDPYLKQSRRYEELSGNLINYSAKCWHRETEKLESRIIVGSSEQIDYSIVFNAEHIVAGRFDHEGVFHGKIKAFGTWVDDKIVIAPPADIAIPMAQNTRLGPFDLFIAATELEAINTTHSHDERTLFATLYENHAGMMMHRDALRVLPYGRTDADYFDIEKRRTKNAGRYFWSYRKLFGRVGVSNKYNPNLKDKAGREGVIDNRAARTLKALVTNLFLYTADNYFGRYSDNRKTLLPQIKERNLEARAEEDRKKDRARKRKKFRSNLTGYSPKVSALKSHAYSLKDTLSLTNERDVDDVQDKLDAIKDELSKYVLGDIPSNLSGEYIQKYAKLMTEKNEIRSLCSELQVKVNVALEEISKADPVEHVKKRINGQKSLLSKHVKRYSRQIKELQTIEFSRINDLIEERLSLYDEKVQPILSGMQVDKLSLQESLDLIEKNREAIELENEELFEPYISVLESLNQSIDMEALAVFGTEKVTELTTEIDRLNALAQLGIAVEILGHELQSYDDIIGYGLNKLPDDLKSSDAYLSIETGYHGLTNQLRFLSPLKLSGHKVQKDITGKDILDYILNFFDNSFEKNGIEFTATDEFLRFSVFDQPSRLYPVFINLINNSRYWVATHNQDEKKIILDVVDGKVVISDNGPGVHKNDLKNLFSLFFTKKRQGGRGVGLYLCRANLTAGGHKIDYVKDNSGYPLSGANFEINFRGAKYA